MQPATMQIHHQVRKSRQAYSVAFVLVRGMPSASVRAQNLAVVQVGGRQWWVPAKQSTPSESQSGFIVILFAPLHTLQLFCSHWRVVCPAVIGSPFGATSPVSTDPSTGKQYGHTFPQITPADQARVHAMLLEQVLQLPYVHAVVGASMGGMQALHFACLFPLAAKRLVCIAATPRTSPTTVAMRHAQRTAIMLDPEYQDGRYWDVAAGGNGSGPISGLRVARQMGMMAYRSREEFDARFDWAVTGKPSLPHAAFEVESYLTYQGKKFAGQFDANCYLLLSRCMDLMDIAQSLPKAVVGGSCRTETRRTPAAAESTAQRYHEASAVSSSAPPLIMTGGRYSLSDRPAHYSYQEAAARIRADCLLIGIQQDTLCPQAELRKLQEVALSSAPAGSSKHMHFHSISSVFGHDSFLHDFLVLGGLTKAHLTRGLEQQLAAEEAHTTGLSAP